MSHRPRSEGGRRDIEFHRRDIEFHRREERGGDGKVGNVILGTENGEGRQAPRIVRENGFGLYGGRVSQIRLIAIRDTELSIDEVRAAVADPAAGGIVLFAGAVRDNDSTKGVTALSYSAHPSAEAELRSVAEAIAGKYADDVIGLAAVHRTGDLAIGDLAVVVGVSCGHRAEAFAACRALIDELKASVPIWKHQLFTDGSAEWVGGA
jgi:molybdopterin synthase catalytic subunit